MLCLFSHMFVPAYDCINRSSAARSSDALRCVALVHESVYSRLDDVLSVESVSAAPFSRF